MTGVDLLKWMRDNVPHVKRIVYSAIATVGQDDISHLADKWFTKPADPDQLLAAAQE